MTIEDTAERRETRTTSALPPTTTACRSRRGASSRRNDDNEFILLSVPEFPVGPPRPRPEDRRHEPHLPASTRALTHAAC
ncbi:MAG: hypothetical protein MZW92_60460 [Comamonadaceae bacterium]|nr:hypothetical protein [Comamonadaceae bacterium]